MNLEKMEKGKIDELAALVCERLSEKRVGFLWRGAPLFFNHVAGFTWIHYYYHHRGDLAGVVPPRVYALRALDDPMSECKTLDMLVMPRGCPSVMVELGSGVVFSKESALVEGALRRGVPVLFDASFLKAWRDASDPYAKERWEASRKIIDSLKKRGMEFIGLEKGEKKVSPEAPKAGEGVSGAVTLSGGGWFSWSEIAPITAGAGTVRLAGGTKLTPEAADRLMKLNVKVEEVF